MRRTRLGMALMASCLGQQALAQGITSTPLAPPAGISSAPLAPPSRPTPLASPSASLPSSSPPRPMAPYVAPPKLPAQTSNDTSPRRPTDMPSPRAEPPQGARTVSLLGHSAPGRAAARQSVAEPLVQSAPSTAVSQAPLAGSRLPQPTFTHTAPPASLTRSPPPQSLSGKPTPPAKPLSYKQSLPPA